MNTKFLSPALAGELKQAGLAGAPRAGIRFSQSLTGQSGESFLLLYDGEIALADKEFGKTNFRIDRAGLAEICCQTTKDEAKDLEFKLTAGGNEYMLAVSFVEYDDAKAILSELAAAAPEAEAKPQAVLFTAGLIFAAQADNAPEEVKEKLLRQMALPGTLPAAREYCAKRSLEEYAYAVNAIFSPAQKHSLLANLLEFQMADLTFHSAEAKFFFALGEMLNQDADKCRTIYQIILDKNNLDQLFCS